MITKKQAHLLAAYEFKLVYSSGKEALILEFFNEYFRVECDERIMYVYVSCIGVDYFILCRPYSQLTEEIEHAGEGFIPSELLGYNDVPYVLDYLTDEIEKGTIYSSEIDALLTWNFKPQWLDERLIKYIN